MIKTAALCFPLLLMASMLATAAPPTFLEAAESAAKMLETEKRGDGKLGDAFQIVSIGRAPNEGDPVSWYVGLEEKSPDQPARVSKELDGKTYRLSIKVLQTGLAELVSTEVPGGTSPSGEKGRRRIVPPAAEK